MCIQSVTCRKRNLSGKYKIKDLDKLYFITYSVVGWIDLFIRYEYRQILLDSWTYCRKNKGLEIYGWCIMTSHVHMIVGSGKGNLPDIVRDMKRHTSEMLHKAIKSNPGESRREWMLFYMEQAGIRNSNNLSFQLWQQDNRPVELFNLEMAWQKLNYIHDNPVKAGIVEKAEEYLYSSAKTYYTGGSSLIEIEFLDQIARFV